MEKKKKKNAGTHGGREHWPVSLRSIHFCAPLHESYLRTASYFSNPNKSCFPIRVSQTESPMLHISIFFNNHSTYYLLDVLTKTDRRIRKKKKKEKTSLSLGTNENDRKVNKRSRQSFHEQRPASLHTVLGTVTAFERTREMRHAPKYKDHHVSTVAFDYIKP